MPAHPSSTGFRLGLVAAAALATALPAFAQSASQRTSQPGRAPEAGAQVWRALSVDAVPTEAPRVVLVCDPGAIARRNFERRFGQEPVFVTAEQALAARDRNDAWSAPRCMTQRQLDRLVERLD